MTHGSDAGSGNRFLAGFALLSLATVAVGSVIAAVHDVPPGSWARNLVAWVVGAAAAWVVARWPSALPRILLVAPAGLVATLVNPGQEDVHRWIDIGPVHMNAAAVLLPPAVVALAALTDRRWSWMIAAATLALLVLQPDASQATAFGAAMLVVLAAVRGPAVLRAAGAAATVLGVAVAWFRPDPLEPVPEVEEIIGLAWGWSPVVAITAVVLLAATVLWPLRFASAQTSRTPALALAACCLAAAVTPAFGAFPVPLVGVGMSTTLGFWLGAGALVAAHRSGAEKRAS